MADEASVALAVEPEAPRARRGSAAELVTGSISLPSAEQNTLDEPVSATIVRGGAGFGGSERQRAG